MKVHAPGSFIVLPQLGDQAASIHDAHINLVLSNPVFAILYYMFTISYLKTLGPDTLQISEFFRFQNGRFLTYNGESGLNIVNKLTLKIP